MNLIFIYGLPGVGKLTVAKKLAQKTGYKLFHNHMTRDLAYNIFEENDHARWIATEGIRKAIFKVAGAENINIIFTYVYAYPIDDEFIKEVIELIGEGSSIKFVQLTADLEEIKKRIVSESRKEFHKIRDVTTLEKEIETYDMFTPIKGSESLIIDNTNLSAEDTAEKIIQYYKL